ncbi:MAG: hypothetical protein ABI600_00220 [Luteolibacter sp.]
MPCTSLRVWQLEYPDDLREGPGVMERSIAGGDFDVGLGVGDGAAGVGKTKSAELVMMWALVPGVRGIWSRISMDRWCGARVVKLVILPWARARGKEKRIEPQMNAD